MRFIYEDRGRPQEATKNPLKSGFLLFNFADSAPVTNGGLNIQPGRVA
jgi:hypothetical protein